MEKSQNKELYPKTFRTIISMNGVVIHRISSIGTHTQDFIGSENIPYIMDVDKGRKHYDTNLDNVIIVAQSEPVAVKCAKYLYDNFSVHSLKEKYEELPPITEDDLSDSVGDEDDLRFDCDDDSGFAGYQADGPKDLWHYDNDSVVHQSNDEEECDYDYDYDPEVYQYDENEGDTYLSDTEVDYMYFDYDAVEGLEHSDNLERWSYKGLYYDTPNLKLIDMSICNSIKGIPINIHIALLESIKAEGIIFEGLHPEDEDLKEKFDAVIAGRYPNKYVIITPDMVNNPFVTDLRMEHYFKLINIAEVPDTYYERIFAEILSNKGYSLENGLTASQVVNRIMKLRGKKFSEEDMDWMISNAIIRKIDSGDHSYSLSMEDFTLNGKFEQPAFDRLSSMPGLEAVKEMVIEQTALLKERRRNGKLGNMHGNMIFYGNPGTGKTTCARLLAEIMGENGVSNASITEVSRADIIGEYVGTTAVKIAEIFEKARGGVLFVDEAGFFLNTNAGGYVNEAIKEFVRFMENYPDVIVIFAMYEREAEAFLKLDEGLASRISRMIEFKDYSDKELSDIFIHMAKNNGYTVERRAVAHVMEYIAELKKREFFGNAREIRKILESCIITHSVRVMNNKVKNADILTGEDIKKGIIRLSQKPGLVKGEIGFK